MTRQKHTKTRQTAKPMKPSKDKYQWLYWLFAIPVIAFCVWAMQIECITIFDIQGWWLILCLILGFTIGIVRLARNKEIVWNWKEYFGGIVYAIIHSVGGLIFGVLVIFAIELMNYYIPTHHPFYNETATILCKEEGNYRTGREFRVEFDFENEKIGSLNLRVDIPFYNQAEPGDTYIFTLQNGFFNIPVIKDKVKQESISPKNELQNHTTEYNRNFNHMTSNTAAIHLEDLSKFLDNFHTDTLFQQQRISEKIVLFDTKLKSKIKSGGKLKYDASYSWSRKDIVDDLKWINEEKIKPEYKTEIITIMNSAILERIFSTQSSREFDLEFSLEDCKWYLTQLIINREE